MDQVDVSTPLAEAFLAPYVENWNRHSLKEMRRIQKQQLECDGDVDLSFISQYKSPYGYEGICFEFAKQGTFTFAVIVEGSPGQLSFQAYHPVAKLKGDVSAGETWLREHCVS